MVIIQHGSYSTMGDFETVIILALRNDSDRRIILIIVIILVRIIEGSMWLLSCTNKQIK